MVIDNRELGKTDIEQARLVMLKLLRTFDEVCRENNISYWLDGGTLLGAIRHGGFIPWDDDIDIVMLSDDYERFIKIASEELPDDIFLQTRQTDKEYPLYITKLRDKYSTYKEENIKNCSCHKGIFIDIFVMDFVRFPFWQRNLKIILHDTSYSNLGSSLKTTIQSTVGFICKRLISKLNLPFFIYLNRLFHSKYEKASCLAYRMEINDLRQLSKELVFPLKEYNFEGYSFFIPNNYDAYLHEYFGDYMQLPPIEERQSHNIGILPFQSCDHKETLQWRK